MKKLVISFLLVCLCQSLTAQSDSDTKSMINKIKRSMSYLSAEATMPTEEEAMATAKELLVGEINDWVSTKRKGDEVKQVVLQDINSCTQLMDMKRGSRTRAFVYVKKKDIVLIYGEGQLVLSDDEIQSLNLLSDSSDEKKSVLDEVEASAPEVKSELSPLEMILGARSMTDMKPVFATLKGEGKITYGIYSANEVLQDCYLLFYDRSGVIKGVVKKNGELYVDARAGTSVSLASYNGLGAYWFVFN